MVDGILGLHHVTATVGRAQADLDFFAGVLGLRLVKRTVNFDNPGVFHFYYGDERGTPGTLMTTFPYADRGVSAGTHGAGQITATALSVPPGAVGAWRRRLRGQSAPASLASDDGERFGAPLLSVRDPSGLVIEMVESADERVPWTAGASQDPGLEAAPDDPRATAITGLDHVTITVREAAPTVAFLEDPLGFRVVAAEGPRTRLAIGPEAAGHRVDVVEDPSAPPAVNGLGTVHHVAWAVADDEAQLRARNALVGAGANVTEVRDRQYFRSIYFREPGGVLYEIATLPPGFEIDEDVAVLGTHLRLPPWEEAHRPRIERLLPTVTVPRPARTREGIA